MNRHLKILLWIGMGLAGMMGLTSCGPKANPNLIRISSWGDPQENEILQTLINDFQKQNPNIPVELERVPYGDYTDKLLNQFVAGLAPDVIFVSSENVPNFYPRNLLTNLTPYLKKDHSVSLKDFYPALLKTYQIHGNIYVIPRDIAPVCVVYYNKKAFDEAQLPYPKDNWTTDKFLKDCLKLKKVDAQGNVTQWPFVEDYPLTDAWVYDFGGRFVDNSYKPTRYEVGTPGFLNGIQFRADLMLKYKVMPTPAGLSQQGGVGTSDMFENGHAAMFLSGIWKVPMFRESPNLKWDVVMIPRVKGVPRAVVGGSSGYGIVSTSKHKEEAWKLISFLAGVKGQELFAQTGLVQPARRKVAESKYFLDGQDPHNKKMLLKAVKYSIDVPLATNWKEVEDGIIYPELDKVWTGVESPQAAITRLQKELLKYPPEFKKSVAQ